jgi:hypothetical protein
VIRERGGNSVPAVFDTESQAASLDPRPYCQGCGR